MLQQRISEDNPSFNIERALLDKGYKTIAGIDEAGRGALAGPLVVGLVIYRDSFIMNPDTQIINRVNDSKRLTPCERNRVLSIIEEYSEFACVEIVSHQIIDNININRATEYGIQRLLHSMPYPPDIILLDGNFSFDLKIPVIAIIKGDTKSISIASASVVAKVRRDNLMVEFDPIYPGYGFKKNKGYGTKEHRRAIQSIGPSPIHRRSYKPVSEIPLL
ncbi:MAG: ribonuclease HII [Spirochaetota bacterium]|nr:ribonuclease HII [Spirochaetota bacterium]